VRIAVLQPGYLPWLGFFDQEMSVDIFVLYDDVQYDRRGWRNRNRLKTPDGPKWLSVPVIQKGKYDQLICDVLIDNDRPWRKKHLGTIETFYKKAPYFDTLYPQFEEILHQNHEHLSCLDIDIIKWMNLNAGIETPIKLSSELGVDGVKSERLLGICKSLNADEYYSGAAARHYLDIAAFSEAGVEVYYQEYVHPTYPQLHGDFISHLSALDLMMVALPQMSKIIESGRKWVRAQV